MYTNLAFLLSEQCTHMIKLAVFEGSKKSVFKDRRELSGSLLEQLEEAFDYIDRYNRTRAEFSGLDRLDMRDYPSEAIREALLNAIVHRDYSFSGAAQRIISPDFKVTRQHGTRTCRKDCAQMFVRDYSSYTVYTPAQ